MTSYRECLSRSIQKPESFWADEAGLIDWKQPFERVLDHSRPPFARWFVGGTTNLCHNAVDRHLAARGDQAALIYVSTEVDDAKTYTYHQLHREVNRFAASLQSLGVERGDRVLIYMPMIPEAVFAMLACVRIGAIHSVVFGGFASRQPGHPDRRRAPQGHRVGRRRRARRQGDPLQAAARRGDRAVRGAAPVRADGRPAPGADAAGRRARPRLRRAAGIATWMRRSPCVWLESSEPSYILYTSGTTGKPKGVQRDTGGYAVALTSSMQRIFCGNAGETYFATSDIGWVVGHSYIVYGPLLAGMATVLYEGTPIRPDGGIFWRIVEQHRVSVMFSAPTAIRVLKKMDPALLKRYDLSSLRLLFLAGEPLDEPTARWIAQGLGKPIIDNYWQTETGWPILAISRGVEALPSKFGSPGLPCFGYSVKLYDEHTGEEVGSNTKGVLAIEGPLPPGCMSTIWGDDERFVKTYWHSIPGRSVYSTFDWGIRDDDGYYFILGRTDDVINVAGHRLGTREIEESICSHPGVAEVAVVGVADPIKGQVAVAFAVVRDARSIELPQQRKALEAEVMKQVDSQLGAVARPARVHFVTALPKTRSGKMLRRSVQAICEGRDPGDLTTIEDPTALEQIRTAVASA